MNDPALRIRVLDQRPVALDDALNAVCSMEAYGVVNNTTDAVGADADRREIRVVKANDHPESQPVETALDKRLRQLETDLATQRREMRQLSSDADRWRQQAVAAERAVQSQMAYGTTPSSYSHPGFEMSSSAGFPPTFQSSPAAFQQSGSSSSMLDGCQQPSVQPSSSQRGGNCGRRGGGARRRRQDNAD